MERVIYTAKQKREAIERELAYRRRVYDHRVAEKKMSKALADFQIAIFVSILSDYAELEEKERLV